MLRRGFFGIIGIVIASRITRAQPKPKLRVAAISARGSRDDRVTGFRALFERLAELGYVEGRNLEVDFDATGDNPVGFFKENISRGADVLFVQGEHW